MGLTFLVFRRDLLKLFLSVRCKCYNVCASETGIVWFCWNSPSFTELRNVTVVYTSTTLTEIFKNGQLNSLKRSPWLLFLDFLLPKTIGIHTAELWDQLTEALTEQLCLAFACWSAALGSCSFQSFPESNSHKPIFQRRSNDLLALFFLMLKLPLMHCLQYFSFKLSPLWMYVGIWP